MTDWHPASEPPPEGLPVIAEYHPYQDPQIPPREHMTVYSGGMFHNPDDVDDERYCFRHPRPRSGERGAGWAGRTGRAITERRRGTMALLRERYAGSDRPRGRRSYLRRHLPRPDRDRLSGAEAASSALR